MFSASVADIPIDSSLYIYRIIVPTFVGSLALYDDRLIEKRDSKMYIVTVCKIVCVHFSYLSQGFHLACCPRFYFERLGRTFCFRSRMQIATAMIPCQSWLASRLNLPQPCSHQWITTETLQCNSHDFLTLNKIQVQDVHRRSRSLEILSRLTTLCSLHVRAQARVYSNFFCDLIFWGVLVCPVDN